MGRGSVLLGTVLFCIIVKTVLSLNIWFIIQKQKASEFLIKFWTLQKWSFLNYFLF